MSRQTAQPLIWLARTLTRSRVAWGRPDWVAVWVALLLRACRASMTPGSVRAGLLIRGSMASPFHRSSLDALSDTWRRRNVTAKARLVGGHIGTGSGVIVVVTRDWEMQMDDETGWLADRFEEHRPRLRAVAYRMLGSLTEADDAVQDAWLRVSRAGAAEVENIGGWLTTVVARVCLNMLRGRNRRREESLSVHLPDPLVSVEGALQPEDEALLGD